MTWIMRRSEESSVTANSCRSMCGSATIAATESQALCHGRVPLASRRLLSPSGVVVSRPPAGASPYHTPRDQPLRDCSPTSALRPRRGARARRRIHSFINWVCRARPARATQIHGCCCTHLGVHWLCAFVSACDARRLPNFINKMVVPEVAGIEVESEQMRAYW
jgi:hypothetical protein